MDTDGRPVVWRREIEELASVVNSAHYPLVIFIIRHDSDDTLPALEDIYIYICTELNVSH